jgi:hypothetical protein
MQCGLRAVCDRALGTRGHPRRSVAGAAQQLLELLAQSRVPLEPIDAVLASLKAEPIPPVDPMVTLLLGPPANRELAALYECAHQPGPENQRGHD